MQESSGQSDAVRPGAGAPEKGFDTVVGETYPQLRGAAGKMLKRERRSHTLTPTALVNEAFVRLARQRKRAWASGEGFVAAAVLTMRRVLINHARDRRAAKRGGTARRVVLHEGDSPESLAGPTAGSCVRHWSASASTTRVRHRS